MRYRLLFVTIALLSVGLAGCVSSDDHGLIDDVYDADRQLYVHTIGEDLEFDWAPGSISSLTNHRTETATIGIPFGWLRLDGEPDATPGFALPGPTVDVPAGTTVHFLAPPRDGAVELIVDGTTVTLDPASMTRMVPENEVVSGENVWQLSAFQEANFPHRQVSLPEGNYWTSIDYFEQFFLDLGMDVEVDPYNTEDLTDDGGNCLPETLENPVPDPGVPPESPAGWPGSANSRGFCPGSLANVVATLPGTDPDAPTIFVAGGHFDMVPDTTHAAFDDTSGTVATLELARAMSQFEWRHTLKFGLWGGEEDGILGSQFWVQSNPDARSEVTSYWNLDVVGMSWPAPLVQPDPIVIAAGPDAPSDESGGAGGPVAEELLAFARELQTQWFEYPSNVDDVPMWHYEGIGSGQVAGYAGVNAQSDHTPFAAAGIPAYFIFNGDALAGDNPIGIHNERDTLENMTRYAYFGGLETQAIMEQETATGTTYVWNPEEYATAQQALADSWEVIMWFPFYSTVLQDVGYWSSPSAANQEPPSS